MLVLQPPLARGARRLSRHSSVGLSSTPARAGRPTRLVELFTAVAFNPRSRGAPVQTLITVRLWHLQPPLARGARVGQALTACPAPSTPARAGRPFNHLMRCVGLTFNPRSRGAPSSGKSQFLQYLTAPAATYRPCARRPAGCRNARPARTGADRSSAVACPVRSVRGGPIAPPSGPRLPPPPRVARQRDAATRQQSSSGGPPGGAARWLHEALQARHRYQAG